MSIEEIRARGDEFVKRSRLINGLLSILFAFIGVANLWELAGAHLWFRQAAILVASAGWFLWAIQCFRGVRRFYALPAADAGVQTSLNFYRDALRTAPKGWRRGLPGMILIVLGTIVYLAYRETGLTPAVSNAASNPVLAWLPFGVLLAVWVFVMLYSRRYSGAWIKNELRRLEQMASRQRNER
jgi:hypothetical protein